MQSLLQKNYSDLGIDLNFVSAGTSDLGLSAGNNDVETHRYYFTSDHIGSSNVITDASGTPVQQIEYMPFGESYVDWRELSWNTPYRFTGKEQDPETGLYYYGARYYDSKIGRFMSVDPLAEKFAAWSPYTYALDNSARFIDPDGRMPQQSGPGDPPTPTVAGLLFEAYQGARSGLFNLYSRFVEGSDLRMQVNYQSDGSIPIGNPVVVTHQAKGSGLKEAGNVALDLLSLAPMLPAGKGLGPVLMAKVPGSFSVTIRSLVKTDSKLLFYAKSSFKGNSSLRKEANGLLEQLSKGNFNPGIGTKNIKGLAGILEARSKGGARVYFRHVNDRVDILGYSNKGNQKKVINRLKQVYE